MTTEQLAADIKMNLEKTPEAGKGLAVGTLAYCYNVNSNKMSHAFRLLEAEGVIRKDYMANHGNWVYTLVAPIN